MVKAGESGKETKEPEVIEYIATRECMYDNKWFGMGHTIMADKDFKHTCFVKKSEYVEKKSAGKIYDPKKDALEKIRLGEVMKGVYKN